MKRISISLSLWLLLLLQSCIKEDFSNCNSWLLLKFSYTLNNQYTNLFDAEVQRITVYIFNAEGKYVDQFLEEGNALTNDYVMRIPLPAGTYSVVAYGGDFTTYSVGELHRPQNTMEHALRKGVTDIADFRAELKYITGADQYLYPTVTADDLYAGYTTQAISALNNENSTEVELIKDTKKIKVKISGMGGTPLDVSITASNGRYYFDNKIDPDLGTFKYTPINTSIQPPSMEVDFKMLRLVLGQSPMLTIKNSITSEVIYHQNMIEQILLIPKYATQKDIDREEEFVFEIVLPSGDLTVGISVTINGWKIENVTPDM